MLNPALIFLLHELVTLSYQYGNKVGEGAFRGKASLTYVYPDPLKTAIREILEDNLRDYPNPETPAVRV